MPRIRITRTEPVAPDGIHIRLFQAGWEGDVEKDVANLLVYNLKMAKMVREREMPEPSERAVVESAPEIKEETSEEEIEKAGPEEEIEKADSEEPLYIRVFQFAKKWGISNRLILNKAKDLGIAAVAPASNLSDEEVERLKSALGLDDK